MTTPPTPSPTLPPPPPSAIPPSLRLLPEERQMAVYAELQRQPMAQVWEALVAAGVETDLAGLYVFSSWWRARLRFLEARGRLEALGEFMAEEWAAAMASGPNPAPVPDPDALAQPHAYSITCQNPYTHPHLSLTPDQMEEWADFLFLRTALAEDNLEGYVKLRGIRERTRRTRLDERRMALLEARAARMEHAEREQRERLESGGGLSPDTLELMESMLGMMQS